MAIYYAKKDTHNLEEVFQDLHEQLLQEEFGDDLSALEMVDLDIAYSPVIAIRGEDIRNAIEVTRTTGGNYFVPHPLFQSQKNIVSPEALKVMRLRYLLARGEEMKRRFPQFSR